MNSELQWKLIEAGSFAVAFGLPIVLMVVLRRPRQWRWRAPLVVFISWVSLVLYTTEVYCRVGIARAEQRGVENPYEGFDNNNVAPVILAGWLAPSLCIGIIALGRRFLRRHHE
jgi:hypothetical protein